jgi:hypothetical protein
VLDARVYRTAFIPALVALFVAAFALADRPDPPRTDLPSDVFDGERAFGSGASPDRLSLQRLAADYPARAPGTEEDGRLADALADFFVAPEERGQRAPFTVRRTVARGRETDVQTVIATRPGASERQIVVLANRDGAGLANLSATAALVELARVFKGRDLRKTLVLVSTSGATTGFSGARAWARASRDAPVDAVLVLGDMAGTAIVKPWVVGWTGTARGTPLGLERAVQSAVRREVRSDPGGPRALGQWARRALPATVSAQGAIAQEGLPAVLLSESGELGPAADEPVLDTRLAAFGRAALTAVSAIDTAGPSDGPAFQRVPDGIVTLRNVLTDWSVRLVTGALLLPALLAALDAGFRARRRRVPTGRWLAWLLVAAVPLPVAWLWLRGLAAFGVVEAPDGPVLPAAFPLETSGIVAMASALVAGALATWIARLVAGVFTGHAPAAPAPEAANGFARRRPVPGVDGLAVATGIGLCALSAVTWILNPYAAGVLVLATHLWLFAAGGWRPWLALPAAVAGLVPVVLLGVHYGLALDLGPVDLLWGAAIAAMTGHGLWSALWLGGLLAALAGLVRVVFARRRLGPADGSRGTGIKTRGPLSYAGPGSLGGTESALRR